MTTLPRPRSPRHAPFAAALLLALPLLTLTAGCDDSDDDAGSGTDSGSTGSDTAGSSTTGTASSSTTGTTATASGTTTTATTATTTTTDASTSTTTSSATTDETTGTTGPAGEFESMVYGPIIAANCSCHVSGAPAGLAMPDAATAYTNLVGVTATQNDTMPRVDPNDSANSYIWHKVSGTHLDVGGSGVQMPRNRAPLGQADIDALAAWIDAGANL